MNVYEAVTRRRTIRRFQDKPVPYDILEKCVEAARLAPCGRNRQACEYIINNDAKVLPEIFANIGGSATLPPNKGGPLPTQKAKAYIIVLINKTLEDDPGRRRTTLYDVGLAAGNIILVALEQGIGTCPLLSFDESNLKQILKIPDQYDVALVMAMGYPDESPVVDAADGPVDIWVDEQGVRHVPKRKLADIVHRNKF